MLDNEVKKETIDKPVEKSNVSYTRAFLVKNSEYIRKWKKIIVPFLIISAVAIITVVLLLILRLVDVKIGGK